MINYFTKLLSTLKMRHIILLLCAQACGFTILLGIFSTHTSKSILENTEYVYSYQGFINIIDTVETGYLHIKTNVLLGSISPSDNYVKNIEEYDKLVRANIDEYNTTEYEEQEEEDMVNAMATAYYEYYDLVTSTLTQLENGSSLSSETLNKMAALEAEIEEQLTSLESYLNTWATNDMETLRNDFATGRIFNIIAFTICALIFGALGFFTIRIFNLQTTEINDTLKNARNGDLTSTLSYENHTEFDQMKEHLQITLSNFTKIINDLKTDSTTVEGQSTDLSGNAKELSDSITYISDSIQSVRSATEAQSTDISATVQVLDAFSKDLAVFNNNIETLSNNSMEVAEIASASTTKMDDVSSSIQDVNVLIYSFLEKFKVLSDAVHEINSITTFINNIAAQTNLLALNASIESARVGEAGKGFAVVASEIGQLAEQSKEASNTISTLIGQIASDADDIIKDGNNVKEKLNLSTKTIEDSMSSFKPMFKLLDEIVAKISDLSTSSENITKEKDMIYEKMEQTAHIASEISASTDSIATPIADLTQISSEVSNASTHLHELTNRLNSNVQLFKTNTL